MNKFKRVLSFIMTLVMLVGMMPNFALISNAAYTLTLDLNGGSLYTHDTTTFTVVTGQSYNSIFGNEFPQGTKNDGDKVIDCWLHEASGFMLTVDKMNATYGLAENGVFKAVWRDAETFTVGFKATPGTLKAYNASGGTKAQNVERTTYSIRESQSYGDVMTYLPEVDPGSHKLAFVRWRYFFTDDLNDDSGWSIFNHNYQSEHPTTTGDFEVVWECHGTVKKVPTAPTCTADGYTTYTCDTCSELDPRTVTNYADHNGRHDPVDKLGHDYSVDQGVTQKATCILPEKTLFKCSRCDKTQERQTGDALGHNFGLGHGVDNPDAWKNTGKGTSERDCVVCDYVESRNNTYKIEYLEANGEAYTGTFVKTYPESHTFGTKTTIVNASAKTGYAFGGWYANSDFTGEKVTEIIATDYKEALDGTYKLYAKWVPNTQKITYKYITNKSTTSSWDITSSDERSSWITNDPYDTQIIYDEDTELMKIDRPGWTWDGKWYTSASNAANGVNGYDGKIDAYTEMYATGSGETLYANLNEIKYVITYKDRFDTDYSDTFDTKYYYYTYDDGVAGKEGTKLPTPTKIGYAFAGWYDNEELNGNPITSLETKTHQGDKTFYAKWTPITYTITYYYVPAATGNSENEFDDETELGWLSLDYSGSHTYDSTTTLPTVTRTGWTWCGVWFTDDDCETPAGGLTELAGDGYTANIKLYTRIVPNTYTVEYYDKGEIAYSGDTVIADAKKVYTYNADLDLPEVTKVGYTFDGWYLTSDCTGDPIETLESDNYLDTIKVYAKWTPITYTITYYYVPAATGDSDDEFDTDAEKAWLQIGYPTTHTYDTDTKLPTVTRTGWTWGKVWFTNDDCTTPAGGLTELAGDGYTANIKLYTRVVPNTYTVEYYDKDGATYSGSVIADAKKIYTYNADLALPTVTKTGYTFNGWFLNSDCTGEPVTTLESDAYLDTIKLYAKWTPNEYKIRYYLNTGKTGTTTLELTTEEQLGWLSSGYKTVHTYDTNTDLPDVNRPGWTWYTDGVWYTNAACTTPADGLTELAGKGYTAEIKLYTRVAVNTYNIEYFDEGGKPYSGDTDLSGKKTFVYSSGLTLTAATKKGYTFSGWYTDADCTNSIGTTLAANKYPHDVKLYAKWTANEYSITYYYVPAAKGHSENEFDDETELGWLPDDYPTTHTYDTDTKLPTVTRKGWTWGGVWFTDDDCTKPAGGINTLEGDGYTENIKLYTRVVVNNYKIVLRDTTSDPNDLDGNDYTGTAGGVIADTDATIAYSGNTTITAPTRPGYKFLGWFSSPQGEADKNLVYSTKNKNYAINPTNDENNAGEYVIDDEKGEIYIFAMWTPIERPVKYYYTDDDPTAKTDAPNEWLSSDEEWGVKDDDGNLIYDGKHVYGKKVTKFPDLTNSRPGWTWCGHWHSSEGCNPETIITGVDGKLQIDESNELNYFADETLYDQELALYTYFFQEVYTLKHVEYDCKFYEENPVTFDKEWDATFKHSTTYVLPVPSRNGYNFEGWYLNDKYEGDPITQLDENTYFDGVTVYAKWTPHVYTVQYNLYVKDNDRFAKPTLVTDDNKDTYFKEITFETEYNFDEGMALPENCFLTGYTFKNWHTAAEFADDGSTVITAIAAGQFANATDNAESYVINLYAEHNTLQYNIHYYLVDDGINRTADDGFGTSSVYTGAAFDTDVDTTAANDGKYPEKYNYSDTFTLPTPTRTGYTFKGWYYDADCTKPLTVSSKVYTAVTEDDGIYETDINLYARWQANTTVITLYYHTSDGDTGSSNRGTFNSEEKLGWLYTNGEPTTDVTVKSQITFKYDVGLDLPVINRPGWYMVKPGWFTSATDSKASSDAEGWVSVDANEELYQTSTTDSRLYARIRPYTITLKYYKAEDGVDDGSIYTETEIASKYWASYAYNEDKALPAPTRSGYTFLGWVLKDEVGTAKPTYYSGTITKNTGDFTNGTYELVAQWRPNETAKITYKYGDNKAEAKTALNTDWITNSDRYETKIVYNETTTLPQLSREGWTWCGVWYTTSKYGGTEFTTEISANNDLYENDADEEILYTYFTVNSYVINYYDKGGRPYSGNSAKLTEKFEYTGTTVANGVMADGTYIFDGWYLDEDCTEPLTDNYIEGKLQPINLYANWKRTMVYYIRNDDKTADNNSYWVNNESPTALGLVNQYKYGALTLPLTAKYDSSASRIFCGWYLDSNYANGPYLVMDDSVVEIGTINGKIGLYAKFETEANHEDVCLNEKHIKSTEIITPATCSTMGYTRYTCYCGEYIDVQDVELDPDNHENIVTDAAVAPKCTSTGLTEGSHCEACEAVLVAQEVVPAIKHNWGDPTYNFAEDGSSCTATRECSNKTEPGCTETATATITSAVKIAATCTEKGTTTYTATFTEDWAEDQSQDVVDIEINPDNHDLKSHEAKAPTCTEIGWDAYVTCEREGCDYSTYAEKAALGHKWLATNYKWADDLSTCTATRVCGRDASHVETVTVKTTYAVTTEPTWTTDGVGTYTATFDEQYKDWAKTQTEKVEIPNLVDTEPPVINATEDEEKDITDPTKVVYDKNGMTVTVTVTDTESGVNGGTYTVTDKDGKVVAEGTIGENGVAEIELKTDGEYKITVNATDNDGNLATFESSTIVIDQKEPDVEVITTPEANGKHYDDVQVEVDDDNLKDVTVTLDGVEVEGVYDPETGIITLPDNEDGEGDKEYTIIATDEAGNKTEIKVTVYDDVTPPDVTITKDPNADSTKENVDVTIKATDTETGVKSITYTVIKDGEVIYDNVTVADSEINLTLAGDGKYEIIAKATDNDGNTSDEIRTTVTIDNAGPEVTLTEKDHDVQDDAEDYDNDGVAVKVEAKDELTDVKDITYVITDAEGNKTEGSYDPTTGIVINQDGEYYVEVTVTDTLGNNTTEKSDKIIIDTIAPVIEIPEDNSTDDNNVYCNNTEGVNVNVIEANVEKITVNGEEYTDKAFILKGDEDGELFIIKVTDKVGRTVTTTITVYSVHVWDAGEVTTDPGCETTGVKTYTCTVCGEIKTETIPATGHTEVEIPAVAATCITAGSTAGVKCSVCNTVLTAPTTVNALGHDYVLNEEIGLTATCTTPGINYYECSRCDAGDERTTAVDPTNHPKNMIKTSVDRKVYMSVDAAGNNVRGEYHDVTTCTACNTELDREITYEYPVAQNTRTGECYVTLYDALNDETAENEGWILKQNDTIRLLVDFTATTEVEEADLLLTTLAVEIVDMTKGYVTIDLDGHDLMTDRILIGTDCHIKDSYAVIGTSQEAVAAALEKAGRLIVLATNVDEDMLNEYNDQMPVKVGTVESTATGTAVSYNSYAFVYGTKMTQREPSLGEDALTFTFRPSLGPTAVNQYFFGGTTDADGNHVVNGCSQEGIQIGMRIYVDGKSEPEELLYNYDENQGEYIVSVVYEQGYGFKIVVNGVTERFIGEGKSIKITSVLLSETGVEREGTRYKVSENGITEVESEA